VFAEAGAAGASDLIFLVAMSCLLGGMILITVIGEYSITLTY
jgi:hypothetical protein